MMTQGQQQALLALLQDGDPTTLDLLKQEMLDGGATRLAEYESLLKGCGDIASRHLRSVIDEVRQSQMLGVISNQLADLDTWFELEEFCWTLTLAEHPGLKTGPYTRQFDQWAKEISGLLGPDATEEDQVRALTAVLAKRQRFTGNQEDYYHPRNCYLPWVIEFRQGIPLSLCMVYVLVGRRAGIPVTGISAPGHFLVRVGDVAFDPFYDGRIITPGEWATIRREVTKQQLPLLDTACPPRLMAHRLLLNLRNAYIKRGDEKRRRRVDHYLAVLQR